METQFNNILIYDVSGTELSVIEILTHVFFFISLRLGNVIIRVL